MNGETLNVNINVTIPQLAECLRLLRQIATRQEFEMALIDDLQSDVTDNTSVVDSAVTLLENLSAQLAAAGTDPTKLAAIKAALDSSKTKLAAAVVANTPAAPTP